MSFWQVYWSAFAVGFLTGTVVTFSIITIFAVARSGKRYDEEDQELAQPQEEMSRPLLLN